jgi:hypothetical protein
MGLFIAVEEVEMKINNFNDNQVKRIYAEMIEPLVVRDIRRKKHSFFVYRCNDYQSLNHLSECHKFDLTNIRNLTYIFEKYWSAIDIIFLEIDLIPYEPTKNYFDKLRYLERNIKKVKDLHAYEVKCCFRKTDKVVLSVRTHKYMDELKKLGKNSKVYLVNIYGNPIINLYEMNIDEINYCVETHYGRKGFYVDHGSKYMQSKNFGMKIKNSLENKSPMK